MGVLSELATQLQIEMDACLGHLHGRGEVFLQERNPANARIRSPEITFPTIATLVQDMEKRRDASEGLETARILQLQLKLIKAENEMIKTELQTSIAHLLR